MLLAPQMKVSWYSGRGISSVLLLPNHSMVSVSQSCEQQQQARQATRLQGLHLACLDPCVCCYCNNKLHASWHLWDAVCCDAGSDCVPRPTRCHLMPMHPVGSACNSLLMMTPALHLREQAADHLAFASFPIAAYAGHQVGQL
jgi:hypothetical protein